MFEYLTNELPREIFRKKKITITDKGIVVCDIGTGKILPWDDFIKENLGEIRDYKIDFILKED